MYSGICLFWWGWDGLKRAPTKPLNEREEFLKGRDAEQMKITWSAIRNNGTLKIHGNIPLNDT